MKIVVLIARILLGLEFLVFGSNGFLHFIHMPAPKGLGGQFMGAVFASHYYVLIFFCQVIGGILVLSGFYVPLGLCFLGPLIVNILVFHATMAPDGLPFALIPTVLWLIVFAGYRHAFAGIFAQKTAID